MMSRSRTLSLVFILFLIQIFSSIAQARVPTSATFKYVNKGPFSDASAEYNTNYRTLDILAFPFQLCWYNTTPSTFYLSLGAGKFAWVWDFNRGNPVRENATFSLGPDGNLVLADADGRIAWQSGTSNKGVVGFKLLPNGNMVLQDAKGKFIWQSFNYATDTILAGQSLTNLVSRASDQQNINGPYSLVLESKRFGLYYKGKNSPKPQIYFDSTSWLGNGNRSLEYVRLSVTSDANKAYELSLEFKGGRVLLHSNSRINTTWSYLRLNIRGSFNAYTYHREVSDYFWENTFDLFFSYTGGGPETPISPAESCQIPEVCGNFGLCNNNTCESCPSPNGLHPWVQDLCKPSKLLSCAVKDVEYYKLVGVNHFTTTYTKGDGPIKESNCAKKCTLDCKCAGYFYHQDKSMCWIAYDLMTLIKVADKRHLGYIKY